MAIRFAKMGGDLDGHPKIRRAGRNGREVFLFVLRQNSLLDRSGRVPAGRVESWFVAEQLMMPETEAAEGLVRAIAAGLLRRIDDAVSIVGWDDEWAKAPLDEAERKRRQREKHDKENSNIGRDVTNGHEASGANRDRLDSHASDKKRSEEKRGEESIGRADGAPKPLTLSPEPSGKGAKRKPNAAPLPADWAPSADHAAKARADGTDVKREAEGFRDYHTAKATRFVDWNAAFRSWLGNAVRFGRASVGSSSTRNDPTATALETLRELERVPRAAEGRS